MSKTKSNPSQELKKEEVAAQVAQEITAEASVEPAPKEIELTDVFGAMFDGFGKNGNDELQKKAKSLLANFIEQEIKKSTITEKYNIAIIYDSSTLVKDDADYVYSAVKQFSIEKPVLLILYSYGGDPGAAYLISQLYREHCNGNFLITVPRAAKSAATLICCAANEIHMGGLSELGPIDPQLDGIPALGLKNSIEHIAQLASKNPASSEMFAKYLSLSLKPIDIGYYERVAESSLQYAERLLQTHSSNLPREAKQIAYELVYTYKDHGFVIDKNEAKKILGDKMIKINSPEYELGNKLYELLKLIESFAGYLGYNFFLNGTLGSSPNFAKRKNGQ